MERKKLKSTELINGRKKNNTRVFKGKWNTNNSRTSAGTHNDRKKNSMPCSRVASLSSLFSTQLFFLFEKVLNSILDVLLGATPVFLISISFPSTCNCHSYLFPLSPPKLLFLPLCFPQNMPSDAVNVDSGVTVNLQYFFALVVRSIISETWR